MDRNNFGINKKLEKFKPCYLKYLDGPQKSIEKLVSSGVHKSSQNSKE